VFAHVYEEQRIKHAPRGVACVYLGYHPDDNTYSVMECKSGLEYYTSSVDFHPNVFPFRANPERVIGSLNRWDDLAPHTTDIIEQGDALEQRQSIRQRGYRFDGDKLLSDVPDVDVPPDAASIVAQPYQLGYSGDLPQPQAFSIHCADPDNMEEALKLSDCDDWILAELMEKESFKYHNAFEVVHRSVATSRGKRIFKARPVLKYKWAPPDEEHPNGTLDKRKYRLTIAAFSKMLKEGVDYADKHVNMVRWNAIKMIIAVAVKQDYDIVLFDISTFFLFGKLEDEIYMEIPDRWAEDGECGPDYIWRLLKSVYGLPQAPNRAQKVLRAAFLDSGDFRTTAGDDCVYVTTNHSTTVDPDTGATSPSSGYCASGTHVDDIPATGDSLGLAKHRAALHAKFGKKNVTEKINPNILVGVELTRVRGKNWAKLHQTDYTTKLLEKYSMLDSRPTDTPMDPGTAKAFMLLLHDEHTEESLKLYRSILGRLLWLQQRTRPDLDYTVCLLGRVAKFASMKHVAIATGRPLKYLNGTRTHGLVFLSGDKDWNLSGSSDADLAGDLHTARSILSVHTQLGKYGCIHNGTSLEKKICTSTGQAETYAFASLAKEILWDRLMMAELGFPQVGPTLARTDNDGVLIQSTKSVNHAAAKHYRIAQNFIRQLCSDKVIEAVRVDTDLNPSDMGTKALHAPVFVRHRLSVMGPQEPPRSD